MKKSRPTGPSATEIRMRGQLDQLRRELAKLKKAAGAALAAAPGDEPPATAEEQGQAGGEGAATVDAELAATTDDASLSPEAVAELLAQVSELSAAKQRLSRLYFSQLDENRKRSQKLHKVLENIAQISGELELDTLLQRLAGSIRQTLGFRAVIIWLRSQGTELLHAQAIAGADDAARARIEQQDIGVEQLSPWLQDEFRISNSCFVSHAHPTRASIPAGMNPVSTAPEPAEHSDWEWHPRDVLFVPLYDRRGDLVACASVEEPEDRLVPSQESVELLEIFCQHAVVAIENARLVTQLAIHSRELEDTQRLHNEMLQLKANFVSTISHELRTPLTGIRAYVDTLLGSREQLSPGQVSHFLSVINQESQRLSRLIESVLDVSRFDSGAAHLTRQPVDLAETVRETLLMLDPLAQAGQVSLKVDDGCADTRVDASRDQLRQLVLHLGSNAVKFTPAGGLVTFVLTGDANEVGLDVLDTGIGIPAEALDRVFERFYQVDSSLVRRFGGAGLGLAICKSIAEWHGGAIQVESQPEQGSRFSVRLPRHTSPRVIVNQAGAPDSGASDILRLAIEMVAEVMDSRVVSLMCPDGGHLVIRAAIGLSEDVVRHTRVAAGVGVAGWVAQRCSAVWVTDLDDPREVTPSGRSTYRSRTFMSVPVRLADQLLGVLNVTEPASEKPYGPEECHLLLELADRIAIAWQQLHEAQQRQGEVAGTARALRQMLRHMERGRRQAPHRVPLARAIASELGLDDAQAAIVGFAASIHDVGMRAIGDHVVEGSGALTDEQRAELRLHPELGADILAPLERAGEVRDIVVSHHERWDGSGYPHGLQAQQIPLGARIVAVVDAYESMTVGRPHRAPMPAELALAEIERLEGRQFDPGIVRVLPRALGRLEPSEPEHATTHASPADPGR